GECIETERFDPEPFRIDNLESHRIGLDDLPGGDDALRDDAGDRRDERFGFAPSFVEGGAAVFQALQFEARLIELDARYCSALHERLVADDATLDDGDLLVELALPLPHVGNVDRLDRRRDKSQHIALADPRAELGKSAWRRRYPAADRGLHVAAGIRIGNDSTGQ